MIKDDECCRWKPSLLPATSKSRALLPRPRRLRPLVLPRQTLPLYQIVSPNTDGHYPWHPHAPDSFTGWQPVLGLAPKGIWCWNNCSFSTAHRTLALDILSASRHWIGAEEIAFAEFDAILPQYRVCHRHEKKEIWQHEIRQVVQASSGRTHYRGRNIQRPRPWLEELANG